MIFEGFAGLRITLQALPKAAGGPWIRLRAHTQDVYIDPDTARELASELVKMAGALDQ